MGHDLSLNDMPNSDEIGSTNKLASGKRRFLNANSHNAQDCGGNPVGPSSSNKPQHVINYDDVVMPDVQYSPFIYFGARHSSEERPFQPSVLLRDREDVNLSGHEVRSQPLFLQGSCSNAESMFDSRNHESGSGVAALPHDYEISSGNPNFTFEEIDVGSSSSSGSRILSCQRKAVEGASCQCCYGGSSCFFPQSENGICRPRIPHNTSSNLRLSTEMHASPSVIFRGQHIPTVGSGIGRAPSDGFLSSVETEQFLNFRNLGRRSTSESHQMSLSEAGNTGWANNYFVGPPPFPDIFTDSSVSRPTLNLEASLRSSLGLSHLVQVPALAGNASPFPIIRPLTSVEERNIVGSNSDHPIFASANEDRDLGQEPVSLHLVAGSMNSTMHVPSASAIGPASAVHSSSIAAQGPHDNSQRLNQITEYVPWSLFPSAETDSGNQMRQFFPSRSVGSSSQNTITPTRLDSRGRHQPYSSSLNSVMSSRQDRRGRHEPYPWSAVSLDILGATVRHAHHLLHTSAANGERTHRLISEMSQACDAMHRAVELHFEDFEPWEVYDFTELGDRHRDMRLDVDNMSYEELLALGESIGNVSTGLNEGTIMKIMKQQQYVSVMAKLSRDLEPCCICQEDYAAEDVIGTLDCGHDFHSDCIKQWLLLKNLCPICKATALLAPEQR